MGGNENRPLAYLAILGLWGMFVSVALAAPPVNQRVSHGESRPALDLRSSLDLRAVATGMVVSEKNSDAFPSSLHHASLSGHAEEQTDPQALGSLGTPSRMDSPMQALAHRVHHEGLPVARLWENKSALVSLGLNPKGKPGLWIVQKIH